MWLAALMLAPGPVAPSCTAATSIRVSVDRLATNRRRWVGRCVTVSGPAWYNDMYSDVGGFYLTRRWTSQAAWRHRIGLYRYGGEDEVARARVRQGTVTGIVDTCERIYQRSEAENAVEQKRLDAKGEGEIILTMLTGYCHYTGGTVIHVAEEAYEPGASFTRLIGEGARTRYGSLVVDPPQWISLRRARAVAADVRAAVTAGDRKRLSGLFGKFGAEPEELAYLLDRPDSPFRELRDPRRHPSIAVLVEEVDYGGEPLRRRTDRNAYLCFCRRGDCSKLWPIADFDTWNRPDRPYACLESEEDGAGFHFLRVRIGEAPLAEPARTAFPARSAGALPAASSD